MSGGSTSSNQQSANEVNFGGVVDHGQINISGNVGNGATNFNAQNSATGPDVKVGVSVGMGGGDSMGMPSMPFLMMLNTEDLEDMNEEDLQNLKFSFKKSFNKAKKGASKAAKTVAKGAKKEAKVAVKTVKYEAKHMTPARAAELVKAGALSPIDAAAFEYNTGLKVAGKGWKAVDKKSYKKKGAILDKAHVSKKTIKKAKVVAWEGAKIATELCAQYSQDPRCEMANRGMNFVDDVAATKKKMILVNLENNHYLY